MQKIFMYMSLLEPVSAVMKYSVCVCFSNVHVVWMICPVLGFSTCIVYFVSAVQNFSLGEGEGGEDCSMCSFSCG